MPGPPSSLSPEARAEARQRYESGEPIAVIARTLGTHRMTLQRLREREEWTVTASVAEVQQVSSAVQRQAQSQVIELAAYEALKRAEASGTVERVADVLEAGRKGLEKHGALSDLTLAFAERMMQSVIDGEIVCPKNQSPSSFFAEMVSGMRGAIALSREVFGRKAGQESMPQTGDASAPIIIERQKLETLLIPVDDKGRMVRDEEQAS
jgi:hypothetical protein